MSKRFRKQKISTAPIEGKTIKISVPLPKFDPNKRGKNYLFESNKRKRDVKKAKSACRLVLSKLTDQDLEELGLPWKNAKMIVYWYHPTSRHKDPWNIVDCLKGTLDGIERAKIIWNDTTIQPPEVHRLTDTKNPRVEITIIQIE